MSAARAYRSPQERRLLVIDGRAGRWEESSFDLLLPWLKGGDALVVNDAATFPASLDARSADGTPLELRLLGGGTRGRWQAVAFGAGPRRAPTELRNAAPALTVGAKILLGGELTAVIENVEGRLLTFSIDEKAEALWKLLYRSASPVLYSYLRREPPLWALQTAYAARPWAAEMPSAGAPLTWERLLSLRRHGVAVLSLTHATGLSSIGDAKADAALPYPERTDLPAVTAVALATIKAGGGAIVAAGTTVVRALEGRALRHGGRLLPGDEITDAVIERGHTLRWVDGILTGMHDATESHHRLLSAFVDEALLREAYRAAERLGFQSHEFGDACLILKATR